MIGRTIDLPETPEELPYGGNLNAARKARDIAAIRSDLTNKSHHEEELYFHLCSYACASLAFGCTSTSHSFIRLFHYHIQDSNPGSGPCILPLLKSSPLEIF